MGVQDGQRSRTPPLGTDINTRGSGGTAATVHLGFGGYKHMGIVQLWVGSAATPVPVELSEWTLE
jgi:hypothetical protein